MTLWTCPDCDRTVNKTVNGRRCPYCQEEKSLVRVVAHDG